MRCASALLSRAAALLGGADSPLDWRPDVVHCNDWPTALAPLYLKRETDRCGQPDDGAQPGLPGPVRGAGARRAWRCRAAIFSVDRLEFYGRLSFLKGGLACADAITTVSPAYAAEIQTEAQGCGLDGLLRHRREALNGILNGIDDAVWDPARDALIAGRYDAASLDAKRANKAALQQRMELRVDAEMPLLGMVGRLTHQKGIDLVLAAAEDLLQLPAQLVVLGKGDRAHEHALKALAARHPGAGGGGRRLQRGARAPDRGGRRPVPDAFALRALRPEPDVQPEVRHPAGRARHRRTVGYRRGRGDRLPLRPPRARGAARGGAPRAGGVARAGALARDSARRHGARLQLG